MPDNHFAWCVKFVSGHFMMIHFHFRQEKQKSVTKLVWRWRV